MDHQTKGKIPALLIGEKIPILIDEPMAHDVQEPTEWNKAKFPALDETSKRLYDEVAPSVVYVRTYDKNNELTGTATGFALNDGRFLTARHVVDDTDHLTIETALGEILPVVTIVVDKNHDVAIVKPTITPKHSPPGLELEKSDQLHSLENVFSFGHPRGLKPTYVAPGVVTGVDTRYRSKIHELSDMKKFGDKFPVSEIRSILVDEYVNESNTKTKNYWHQKEMMASMHSEPGCSGAPIVNTKGHVVGLLCDSFAGNTKLGLSNNLTGFAGVEHIKALLKKNAQPLTNKHH